MFSFFKRRTSEKVDFSFLQTDFHSHLIPGIDDGAKTVEESVELIRGLIDLGFSRIITTPHIMGDHYPNSAATILSGLEVVKTALKEAQIDIPLEAAAEYFVDEYFEKLLAQEERLLTFGDNYLLIEFSTFAAPSNFQDIIFQLKTKGYQPILAHPERYLYFAKEYDKFEKLKSLGCYFQVNLLSLTGHYGKGQKKLAIQLLNSAWVDFLATDLHRKGHLEKLKLVRKDKTVAKLLDKIIFKNTTFATTKN